MSRYSSSYDIKRTLKTNEQATHAILPMFTDDDGTVYGDDSPTLSLLIGAPSKGKTVELSEFIKNAIFKEEACMVGDTKGVLYAMTAEMAKKAGYRVVVINCCDPRNSDGIEPLKVFAKYYKEGGKEKDSACENLYSMLSNLVPKGQDAYWIESPIDTLMGAAMYLFEFFSEDEISTAALHDVLNDGEQRVAGDLMLKEMADLLEEKLNIPNPLNEAAHAPCETRASTMALSKATLAPLTARSEGIQLMLQRDNIDLVNWDCEQKAIFYFIMPDESDLYTKVSALLFDMVIKRYYKHVRESGKPLQRRLNIVIDELGNLAKAMGDFSAYCTASRSRNIRIVAAIHSYAQLKEFGEAQCEIIKEATANTIAYSLYNIQTLMELSQRSGTYKNPIDGSSTPTISPESISKLQTGHVLVFSGELIFCNRFEFDPSKSTDVPIVFPKREEQDEQKPRTAVLRPVLEAKTARMEEMLNAKLSEESERLLMSPPKKSNALKRLFRRLFRRRYKL